MADISSLLGSAGIGGAIGKAIVSLELDTKKYNAELAASEAKTKTATTGMASSTSKFSGLASNAFAAVGIAAVAGLALSVKAAVEANEAHIKLQNTFKNNANLSDSSVEAFEAQADALRELTGVDDEAIISSQALLGAFDLTGKQVQELTPLIVDLSAKYGIDLDAAAKAVGKAIEGSTGALSRYGIMLDEVGPKGDTFSTVLEGLGKNAGFAEERADAEPWRVLGSQLEEVAEDIGRLLIPVLQKLVDVVGPLVDVLGVLADNMDVVIVALAGFAAFKYLPGLLLNIAGGFEAIGAARISGALASTAAGIDSVAVSLGVATPAAAGFALAYGGITAAVAAWDPLGTVDDVEALRESMEVTTKAFGESEIVLGRVAVSSNLVGNAFDDTGRSLDEMRQVAGLASEGMLNLAGETAKTKGEVEEATQKIKNFAHLSDKELQEWSDSTKESFDTFIESLEDVSSESGITARDFRKAHNDMLQDARELSKALRDISKEKWINDEYIAFLSEQGPEWLIAFADLTEKQQRKAQDAWGESTKKTDAAKDSLDRITGVLDKLDKGESKHKITIEYHYVGFDPSKPGMQGTPQQR